MILAKCKKKKKKITIGQTKTSHKTASKVDTESSGKPRLKHMELPFISRLGNPKWCLPKQPVPTSCREDKKVYISLVPTAELA